jgi:DNA-binding transcriptional ArsR family regulator
VEHPEPSPINWRLLSSHARVLLAVLDDDQALRSEIAERTDVTERTVSRIINDLEEAGYLAVDRTRRRNRYRLGDRVDELVGADEVRALDRLLMRPGDAAQARPGATGAAGDGALSGRVAGIERSPMLATSSGRRS